MTVQNAPEMKNPPHHWGRRFLYYVIAILLVTVTMKVGSPERLCSLADGVTESVSKVDAFYVTKQAYTEYRMENRRYINHVADTGAPDSLNPYSSGIGLILKSIWRALRSTVAADWATLLISLFALLLSLIIMFRLIKDEPPPFTILLAIPLSGLIAFVLKYILLIVSYPFGCGGQFMVALLAVWPIIKTALDVRDMAQSVEGAAGIFKSWRGRGAR